jgi:acyl transferase domain-containing protein/acyl carrier protein
MIDRTALSELSPLARAAFAVRALETQLEALRRDSCEPIAIIGIACRFPPDACDPDRFWKLLCAGFDANREVPPDRFDVDAHYDPAFDRAGKMYVRRGAFLDDVDRFDAAFFGISPREAERMDPQQRLLLEVAWEAIEDAGIPPDSLRGSDTGCFLGVGQNDYMHEALPRTRDITIYDGSGNAFCFASGRVSYVLGLQGPNLAIDTACSSSLVCVHLACQALRRRECELALAAGVHLVLSPVSSIALCNARVLSPDGLCKTFDARADGYGRGEGCGVVVLKRLTEAEAAGDRIMAVIRGSSVNHGGAASGLTVPNGQAQEALLRAALQDARVSPDEVDLIETHGTGTSLGDPIEVKAIGRVFCGTGRSHPLALGAVKSNFGHLEAAAGIIGLIKVVQCLRHEAIPANLHLHTPNPLIPWERLAVDLPRQNRAWPRGGRLRIAGVSSFGISGTNAHVVVGEAAVEPRVVAERERGSHLLMLSARTPDALAALCGRMAERVAAAEPELGDICFTAHVGRSRFAKGLAVVGSSASELAGLLGAAARGETPAGVQRGPGRSEAAPKLGFLFTGQGAQHVGMGRALYAGSPVFRAAVERCAGVLDGLLERPLVDLLYAGSGEDLERTGNTQPALFTVEWALAELWRSWGIVPSAVLGHSVGEYVAACVAGVMEVEDALRLIAARGRLMQALPADGAMVAALAGEAQVSAHVARHGPDVSIAAVNGPASVVVSGRRSAVEAIAAALAAEGVTTRRLAVSHAFHSPLMAPMLEPFGAAAARVRFRTPELPLVSNVTGTTLAGAPDAAYWVAHVSAPVRFADGLATLVRQHGSTALLELGPRPTLLGLGRAVLPDHAGPWLASLRPDRPDWVQMLESLGTLALAGSPVDWHGYDRPYLRRKTALPTYPFQRQRFWHVLGPAGDVDGAEVDLDALALKAAADGSLLQDERAALPRLVQALKAAQAAIRAERTPVRDIIANGLYEVSWREGPAVAAETLTDERSGRWVLFVDSGGFGTRLAATIAGRGGIVIEVRPGASYCREADRAFRVAPDRPEDFARLWQALGPQGPLAGVLYCWALDADLADIDAARVLTAEAPVWAIRQLLAGGEGRLWLIGRGAVDVGDDAPLSPAQAPLWGLAKVLALECRRHWGGFIDVESGLDAQVLLPELFGRTDEDQVALRGRSRLVPRLDRVKTSAAGRAPVDPAGAYLISGGLGGLGLTFAEWLVSEGARHLWLVGRRPPDETAQRAIAVLRRQGAQVTTAAADVADAEAIAGLMDAIAARGAPLKGVLHAAGVDSSCFVTDLTPSEIRRVYRAKMEGAWALHRATLTSDLDFFVLFSSISATWGSKAQAHYAGANAFLDLLARARRRAGLPATSIAWGPWEGVGMMPEEISVAMRRIGITALGPRSNVPVLSHLIGAAVCQATAVDVDWNKFLSIFETAGRRPFFDLLSTAEMPAAEPEPPAPAHPLADLAQLSPEDRLRHCIAEVRSLTGAILGLDGAAPAEIDQGFFDMGFDSLMSLELKNRLEVAIHVPLPPTLLFDHPTIRDVAAFIAAGKLNGAGEFDTDRPPVRPPAAEQPGQDIDEDLEVAVSRRLQKLEALMRQG